MVKEIEELVDHLALILFLILILLISCVLGEAWKSYMCGFSKLGFEIYLYLPGWVEGKGGILLVILLCKFKKP